MSADPDLFTRMYERSPDPWHFRSRWYERRKRALTLAALPEERYGSAFEPGCSIGLLTRDLADRCSRLLAMDSAPGAVAQARRELSGVGHVRVVRGRVPESWPEGSFDLVVLSEVLYYFGDTDLQGVLDRTLASSRRGATVIAVHWRHAADEHVRTGDDVHRILDEAPWLARTCRHVEDDFVLETFAVEQPGAARGEGP
ncbi:class I SAM-dependent DNA methyltransferase [Nocardiopsis xinjiangensis]|uniref:class I SAM-dependent DNA methyltransferase n=1 Tax=Nocardiopsis xinjiangensis TaxID=124285 RepID=UPI000346C150|nr:class I SAM-dependent methyltransferase [Nocardiopsis xinjiangensis]